MTPPITKIYCVTKCFGKTFSAVFFFMVISVFNSSDYLYPWVQCVSITFIIVMSFTRKIRAHEK